MRLSRVWLFFSWFWTSFFWLAWVAVPLAFVLERGFHFRALLDPEVLSVARATLQQALVSTVFSALFGLPLGLWIGSLKRRGAAQVLLALPFGVPTVAAGTAWV